MIAIRPERTVIAAYDTKSIVQLLRSLPLIYRNEGSVRTAKIHKKELAFDTWKVLRSVRGSVGGFEVRKINADTLRILAPLEIKHKAHLKAGDTFEPTIELYDLEGATVSPGEELVALQVAPTNVVFKDSTGNTHTLSLSDLQYMNETECSAELQHREDPDSMQMRMMREMPGCDSVTAGKRSGQGEFSGDLRSLEGELWANSEDALDDEPPHHSVGFGFDAIELVDATGHVEARYPYPDEGEIVAAESNSGVNDSGDPVDSLYHEGSYLEFVKDNHVLYTLELTNATEVGELDDKGMVNWKKRGQFDPEYKTLDPMGYGQVTYQNHGPDADTEKVLDSTRPEFKSKVVGPGDMTDESLVQQGTDRQDPGKISSPMFQTGPLATAYASKKRAQATPLKYKDNPYAFLKLSEDKPKEEKLTRLCAWCNRAKDDAGNPTGQPVPLETQKTGHSHGICNECKQKEFGSGKKVSRNLYAGKTRVVKALAVGDFVIKKDQPDNVGVVADEYEVTTDGKDETRYMCNFRYPDPSLFLSGDLEKVDESKECPEDEEILKSMKKSEAIKRQADLWDTGSSAQQVLLALQKGQYIKGPDKLVVKGDTLNYSYLGHLLAYGNINSGQVSVDDSMKKFSMQIRRKVELFEAAFPQAIQQHKAANVGAESLPQVAAQPAEAKGATPAVAPQLTAQPTPV